MLKFSERPNWKTELRNVKTRLQMTGISLFSSTPHLKKKGSKELFIFPYVQISNRMILNINACKCREKEICQNLQ